MINAPSYWSLPSCSSSPFTSKFFTKENPRQPRLKTEARYVKVYLLQATRASRTHSQNKQIILMKTTPKIIY